MQKSLTAQLKAKTLKLIGFRIIVIALKINGKIDTVDKHFTNAYLQVIY